MENGKALEELIAVMDELLAPEGCPWDREQTHQSLQRYLIEESYEVVEAIQEGSMDKLREELGDVLLQVVFHSALAEREGYFNFSDVAVAVKDKMIQRHPHVFGELKLATSNDVLERWEGFKKKEGKKYILEGIPAMLPALMRAEKMQEKAARVGFDWPTIDGAWDKFREEIDELRAAGSAEEIVEEMGDILFALVNVARFKGVDPEAALQATNNKFARRFRYIEECTQASGKQFSDFSLEELDHWWEEAKGKGL
ncbi:MAG: nucleoside triphosphate pyrophosphohydrolase [Syntrophomonadaceae bacterium]|nr:nucleoside triphosphate pyrophosphohydrolase [Syntrophomonadaceae bacterium]